MRKNWLRLLRPSNTKSCCSRVSTIPTFRAFMVNLLKVAGRAAMVAASGGLAWTADSQWRRMLHTPQPPYSPGLGGTIYTYSDEPVNGWLLAVVWSPDGRYIVSASFDGTVQVWDAK